MAEGGGRAGPAGQVRLVLPRGGQDIHVKAVLLDKPAPIETAPLRVADVAVPEPGQGQVLIRVAACGVCRSNLHMVEGDWLDNGVPAQSPIIPGHEVVGTIVGRGEGVDWPEEGTRVGVQPLWSSCLHCEWCLTGREQLCPDKHITGETVDGGYAEYLLATAAHVHPVPEGLDSAEAAPLFCPGITAFGAVSAAELAPNRSVAVFGIGGVGHMVLQIAALHGGEIIAVSRSRAHRELAEELGATRTVDSSADDAGRAIAAAGGVDAAIVFAPSDQALAQAVAAVKPGGRIVLGVFARLGTFPFVEGKTLVGTVIGSRHQMRQVLNLAAAGKIRAVVETAPLEQAQEVLGRLKRGEVRARAVLTMGPPR